jgi:chromosome segregation ATPase
MAFQTQIEALDESYRTYLNSMNGSYVKLDGYYRSLNNLDYSNAKDAKAIQELEGQIEYINGQIETLNERANKVYEEMNKLETQRNRKEQEAVAQQEAAEKAKAKAETETKIANKTKNLAKLQTQIDFFESRSVVADLTEEQYADIAANLESLI